jgi:hypothetical protein
LAWHGHGYDGERRRLREWWGITTRAAGLIHNPTESKNQQVTGV